MTDRLPTVVQYSDSLGYGGMERVVESLIGGLAVRGWRPVLMIHDDARAEPLLQSAAQAGVHVEIVGSIRGRHAPRGFVAVAARLARLRPAVFHAHMAWQRSSEYGRLAAAISGVPAIVATTHLHIDAPGRLARVTPRLASLVVDRYAAVSTPVANLLASNLKIPRHKITVIENGIDTGLYETLRNQDVVADLRAGRKHAVVTVAQLREQKGHRYLVDALPAMPDASFIFVGDGPEREAIEHRAQTLGVADRVRLMGFRADVSELLAAADVFVLPSLAEGLPLALLEAMAAGTPVVATSVGGIPDVISDGHTGLLVPPRDAEALTRAITRLLDDADFARQLADSARARVVGRFSVDTMIDHYSALYDLLGRSTRGRVFPLRR